MKKVILALALIIGIGLISGYTQEIIKIRKYTGKINNDTGRAGDTADNVRVRTDTGNSEERKIVPQKILLLISEQNIEGPRTKWWLSEVNLSTTEADIAKVLIAGGYEIIDPSVMNNIIKQRPAFRYTDLSDDKSVKLGNLSDADYVVTGKAVASSGGKVPNSNMSSYFANISAKLIKVKSGKIIAYLTSSGKSVHIDPITGGKEALIRAADKLASKIVKILGEQY